jgi:hypothetical protein
VSYLDVKTNRAIFLSGSNSIYELRHLQALQAHDSQSDLLDHANQFTLFGL